MTTSFPAPAESSQHTSADVADGECALQAPHTVSGAGIVSVSRVVRLPMVRPDPETWRHLIELMREAAQFGNKLLGEFFAADMGWKRPEEGPSAFVAFTGQLGGEVRVAIAREAWALWKRHRGRVLRGDHALPSFRLDRCLVVRGNAKSGTRSETRRVKCETRGGIPTVTLRLEPASTKAALSLSLWEPALRRDWYLASTFRAFETGQYRVTKVAFVWQRRRGKLSLYVSYEKPIAAPGAAGAVATFGPLEADGSLWLRTAGASWDWSPNVYQLREKKTHFEDIRHRLRVTLGRGRRHGRRRRRVLAQMRTYEQWAGGKLHPWSKQIVDWCGKHGVTGFAALPPETETDIPWTRWVELLKYKCADAGIAWVKPEIQQPATERAQRAPVQKEQRRAAKARRAAQTLTRELQPTGS